MNLYIFHILNNLSNQSATFDKVVYFIAEPFGIIVIILAIIFLLFHHDVLPSKNPLLPLLKKWREITLVFLSGIFAWIVSETIKTIAHTPRPFEYLLDLKPIFLHGGMDSFPSGHATFFSALAVALYMSHKRVGYLFMVFALLIGLSRIIAGVHFPIDILFGFILGPIVVITIYKIRQKLQ
jgi:undecaprenyl-diphosphatase